MVWTWTLCSKRSPTFSPSRKLLYFTWDLYESVSLSDVLLLRFPSRHFSAPDEDRLMQSLYNVDHVCKWENTVSSCATIACHEKSHCHLVHQHSLFFITWWRRLPFEIGPFFLGLIGESFICTNGYPSARYRRELWPIFCRCLLPLSPFDIV